MELYLTCLLKKQTIQVPVSQLISVPTCNKNYGSKTHLLVKNSNFSTTILFNEWRLETSSELTWCSATSPINTPRRSSKLKLMRHTMEHTSSFTCQWTIPANLTKAMRSWTSCILFFSLISTTHIMVAAGSKLLGATKSLNSVTGNEKKADRLLLL